MKSTRQSCVIGDARGVRYGELPRAVVDNVPGFLDSTPPVGAEVLKPGVVWRVGKWCFKRFAPPRKLVAKLRASPAIRCADLYGALQPVRTPQPLLAVARPRGPSLLVAEFVDGVFLQRAWSSSELARTELPKFFAALNTRGYFHGDLHARNVLWTGRDWVLIDLDGVRPRVHALWLRRRIVDEWGRVVKALVGLDGVRASFDDYLRRMRLESESDALWQRVEQRARELTR